MLIDSQVGLSSEAIGRGQVLSYDDEEEMNVAALLKHLRCLWRAGKTTDVVAFALAEAKALHEIGNEEIGYENFVAWSWTPDSKRV